jgi:archaellum component FlaD/FlaE
MAREKEREVLKKDLEDEEAEAGEIQITPIHAKEESNIEDLDKRLGELKESLDSMREMTGKIGGLEDKMGELSSIYEAFISKYTPQEEGRRPLTEGEEVEVVDEVKETTLILEWLDYLLEKLPKKGAARLLDYYLRIGWIDNALYDKGLNMLFGIKSASKRQDDPSNWRLTCHEHIRCILFISGIRGKEINSSKLKALMFKAEAIWKEGELGL